MAELSGGTWFVLALMAGSCVLGVLHSLATLVRNQTNIHELKISVANLRLDYARRLRDLEQASAVIEAIPVDELPPGDKAA